MECVKDGLGAIALGGVTSHYTLALDEGETGFAEIQQLTRQARNAQRTKREKRRLEIVEGQS